MERQLKYREGSVFSLPLRKGGNALGVVARLDGEGIVLVYVFRPTVHSNTIAASLSEFVPSNAVLVARCGDLGLLGRGGHVWPIVGSVPDWQRGNWTVPIFCRKGLAQTCYRVEYSDDNMEIVSERLIALEECGRLPRDVLYGAGALEAFVTRLSSS